MTGPKFPCQFNSESALLPFSTYDPKDLTNGQKYLIQAAQADMSNYQK